MEDAPGRDEFRRAMSKVRSVADLLALFRGRHHARESYQVERRQTRYTYNEGPMKYLGQQIVRAMQDAGYPAKILYCYRSADKQRELYAKGRTTPGRIVTRARPWSSPHQYSEAVDIIHPDKGWDVSEDYWDTLAACVRTVADRHRVDLDHGHHWRFRDSAHIELADWRDFRERHSSSILDEGAARPPNESELWLRFQEVLPQVAKDYLRRR